MNAVMITMTWIVAVPILLVLAAMVILPLVNQHQKAGEVGPWVVAFVDSDGDAEYLTFQAPDQWSKTHIVAHADQFANKDQAERWADYVGGRVVAWSEVDHE